MCIFCARFVLACVDVVQSEHFGGITFIISVCLLVFFFFVPFECWDFFLCFASSCMRVCVCVWERANWIVCVLFSVRRSFGSISKLWIIAHKIICFRVWYTVTQLLNSRHSCAAPLQMHARNLCFICITVFCAFSKPIHTHSLVNGESQQKVFIAIEQVALTVARSICWSVWIFHLFFDSFVVCLFSRSPTMFTVSLFSSFHPVRLEWVSV